MLKRNDMTRRRRLGTGFRLKPVSFAVAAAVSAMSGAPLVQAESRVIEEVVVTATKRSESVQDVPLAITALSGDFTKASNINDVKDLVSFSPGVSGNSQDSFIDAISVRGIRTQDFGVGGDPSTAFFKNDLYEGRNGSAVTSLYDMERSEVLRGPQGFLFGRNSIGGAFSVHTAKAKIDDHPGGYVEIDAAERGRLAVEAAINIPVNDNFAMRLAGYSSKEDGFVENYFNGDDLIEHDKQGARWSTTYTNDRLNVHTLVEYETREQSGSVYRAIQEGEIWETFEAALGDVNLRGGNYDADSDQSDGDNDDADILTLGIKVEYDLDFATLVSNTGYKDHDYFYTEDYDGTPLNINNYGQDQKGDYFQQEFRLTSNSEGPLSWYAGVSYYKETIDTLFSFSGEEDFFCQYYGYAYNSGMTFSGCADLYAYYGSSFSPGADGLLRETGRIKGDYAGWGAYVDLTYAINEAWDVSLGVRYSDDEKEFAINVPTPDSELGPYWAYTFSTDGYVSDTQSWSDTQTRLLARYQPGNSTLWYASYTEGFKSGGFGSFALVDAAGLGVGGGTTDASQAAGYRPNAFEPETADSWEVGYKGTVADGKVQLGLTGFYYEYEDLQVVVFDGGAASVENVGQVDSWGVEGTLQVLLGEYLDAYVGLSYLDTDTTGLQSICGLPDPEGCEGSSLFWAPEWTGSIVLSGDFPLSSGASITSRLEVFWESERGGGFEGLRSTRIDDFANTTLRVGYRSTENWAVNLYVENLTAEETFDGLNNNGGIIPSHFFGPMRPRTVGISFNYEWD
ncbi:MAG: TonB-dependent receptor [Proteobacteria bacterium]|nr:TonB-dependent receptor [Pseudomonadota bacterium]